jgi:FG-GAP repeat
VLLQTLETPTGLPFDAFGAWVAMSSSHLAVLAPLTSPDGTVYVYKHTEDKGMPWRLEQRIAIQSSFPAMLQNARVAVDGDTLVIGVPFDSQLGFIAGAVYVFQREVDGVSPWHLEQTVFAPDGKHGDEFGLGLDLKGDALVVGARHESSSGPWRGAAYSFVREFDGVWRFRQKFAPDSLTDFATFGGLIDIDGGTLVIGAPQSSLFALQAGAVYVFQAEGKSWVESQVLTSPDIDALDAFGGGLALSGDWLIAASPLDDDLGEEAGAVHLYRRESGRWNHHQKVVPETGVALDNFGGFLAADGETFYVGDPFVNGAGLDSGVVYTFTFDREADQWMQASRYFPPDLDDDDGLGPVAAHDGFVAAGATKSFELGTVYVCASRPSPEVVNYCMGASGGIVGCAPELETLGAPSASQGSTFRIWSREVPGARFGVVQFSEGGPARVDLGAGGLCIPGTNLRRKGLYFSGGTFGACDGTFELDWNEFIEDRDPETSLLRTPGAVVHVQVAWIELLTSAEPAWSDALTFQLCP